jgi:hypothetical protein
VGFILAETVQMMIQGKPTPSPAHREGLLIPPRMPHNALDTGPEDGRMLSTYIVEAGQPLASFVDAPR